MDGGVALPPDVSKALDEKYTVKHTPPPQTVSAKDSSTDKGADQTQSEGFHVQLTMQGMPGGYRCEYPVREYVFRIGH